VFRVPLQVLGIGGTPFASTEALMQSGKRQRSRFALNHIEEAFGQLFGLAGQPEEYVEFDTGALLYAKVEYGDEPRLQQQDVPLSYGFDLVKQMNKPPPAAAAPAAAPSKEEPPPQGDQPNAARSGDIVRELFRSADEIERRAA
jgi:hypothetical protein